MAVGGYSVDWSRQKPVRRGSSELRRPSSAGRRSAGPWSKKAIAEQRTYAPAGQTPVVRECLTHDHLSAMSGITPKGKLHMTVQERSYKGPDVVNFLRHLLRHIPGKLLVLWDGAPIHRSRVVKDFLAKGAPDRVQLEQLPAYAPELSPDEGIWNYLKRVELKNLSCHNLSHLGRELRQAKERLRHKAHIIRAYIKQPGLV